jgi:hypothetical protein
MNLSIRLFCVCVFLLCERLALGEDATRQEMLITHVRTSIERAEEGLSKLHLPILQIDGMSSSKVRHLLNNLCALKDATYLEIGCWKGSTLIAAAYQNQEILKNIVGIDNWKEFGGPKALFLQNLLMYLSKPVHFIEADCFAIDLSSHFSTPITIYFYDGNHSFASQKAAFTYFNSALDDLFIAVVDDWNWPDVRRGTFAAFKELNYKVLYQQELFTPYNADRTSWWNGLYIAVIEK